MRLSYYLSLFAILLFFTGCFAPELAPVKVESSKKPISYLDEVKPILDKRCVSCHSCYNSPCQAKFSAFEGVDRGASKVPVYDALRLKSIDPTRLFIDAQTTDQWRDKGFYSLTKSDESNSTHNDSIMMHMLNDKKTNPQIIGDYAPEADELMCPRNKNEMNEYANEKPNHGMPYGMPQIKDSEYVTLAQWLQQGAHGPTAQEQLDLKKPSKSAQIEINKWETFFNKKDPKHIVTARYLYEHLYLAHWNFKAAPNEYYEIVRSKTPSPKPVELITTLRSYDDPGVDTFYYRLVKMYATPVHKTHMVVEFDDEKLARITDQFINTKWIEKPHVVSYEIELSSRPFEAFVQIPAKSRYQFLLDNSHYVIMTFIRGPVCRGQIALNVIQDHFFVLFQDPDHDLTVLMPEFLKSQAENLVMPIETNNGKVFGSFSDKYKDAFERYFDAKAKLYLQEYPQGVGIDSIWKGEHASDAPIVTIYRHYDSASVHKGVVGGLPRTMWVLDFSQLERIYYLLVAGYDVFGNVSHQTNIRRYFDYIRMEGEENYLNYLPKEKRLSYFKSWYIGDDNIQGLEALEGSDLATGIDYKTNNPHSEFIDMVVNQHILKSTGIKFDNINYYAAGEKPPAMPTKFDTFDDFKNGFRSLTKPGTSFIRHFTSNNINVMHLRIKTKDGSNIVGSLVINRWHDNVNSLFNGEQSNPEKDTLEFVKYSIGSYPNMFVIVDYKDLPDFFDLLKNYEDNDEYHSKIKKYFVSRADKDFWETFDWFQNNFNKSDPLNAGLYDLNRYHPKPF